MIKEDKIWGTTSLIWKSSNTEVHRIQAVQGGYCSKHLHTSKHNLFFVEHGELMIEVWQSSGIVDKTVLCSGESTSVAPGVYHRFTALQNTDALEVYWIEIDGADITREVPGGFNATRV